MSEILGGRFLQIVLSFESDYCSQKDILSDARFLPIMGQITEEPYPSSVAVAYSFLNPQQAQFWFKYTVNMEFYVILHAENDKNSGS